MRVFFDTEFFDDGKTVELISIGVVREDGEELYIENADFDWTKVPDDHWIQTNVRPHLRGSDVETPYGSIGYEMFRFVGKGPEFWAYFPSYDWVVLMHTFGPIMHNPTSWPDRANDLAQEMMFRNVPRGAIAPNTGNVHNALDDARWLRDAFDVVMTYPRP